MNTITINVAEFAGVIAALWLVASILKNATKLPNRIIPLLVLAGGMICYLALTNGFKDPRQWVAGMIASATAIGAHSGLKNTMEKPKDDE